ncbi:MAG: serine/threonine-protein kinase [Synergistaceae bacterium]|jgi:serine/threonine protein kinase|nr:serine/threonine-protein kinase [Synergistaceae bacterium]
MEGNLKVGSVLTSDAGNRYAIIKLLGAGGQGEVYEVEHGGGRYALKWFFRHMATPSQKNIIDNLVAKGAPDSTFLWPRDIISTLPGEPFGYIMELRSGNYRSVVDMMKRRVEPSFHAVCRAAFNLTRGYQKLHRMGYSYRDISFGNLFFNPDTGDVLICDNDNVSVNDQNDSPVYGTPRFMAPEIVTRGEKPSRNTDLYSLSVLLFYMFMLNHPLDGRLEAEIKCLDLHAMRQLYGDRPVFIFDPNDETNRPVERYHDNAIIYWKIYPESLRGLFIQSFTDGLKQPNKRVTERQWLDALANLISGIFFCPNCGAEVFYDELKEQFNVGHSCWNCRKQAQVPPSIVIGRNRVLITSQAKLFSHHLYGDYDMSTVVGSVIKNPNNPKLLGIRNESGENWTYIRMDGTRIQAPIGRTAAVVKDARIDFGQATGEFR